MINLARVLFFIVFVRPFVYLVLGLNLTDREYLPERGPAIIVANHNSHLDTLVLMSILPLRQLSRIRPVANAGYFLRNPILEWFTKKIIGIIPIHTGTGLGKHNVLKDVVCALEANNIIIIYPEGTRGKPEKFEEFKRGIAVLTTRLPDIPIYPVYMYGLGKALPKGEFLLVPFICSIVVGRPIRRTYVNGSILMAQLKEVMQQLAFEGNFPRWE